MWVTALSISSDEAISGESKIWVKDKGPRTCDPKVASDLFNGPRSKKGLPRTSPIASHWDKDPNTHQAHTGYIGSTDNK